MWCVPAWQSERNSPGRLPAQCHVGRAAELTGKVYAGRAEFFAAMDLHPFWVRAAMRS
jgi:hypothetical protein